MLHLARTLVSLSCLQRSSSQAAPLLQFLGKHSVYNGAHARVGHSPRAFSSFGKASVFDYTHSTAQQHKKVPKRSLDDVVSAHKKDMMWRGLKVTEILPGGKVVDIERPISVSELGIPPRDAGLFTSDNTHATNQGAAIMVRNDKILFKTEAARAVISENRAFLVQHKAPGSKSHKTSLRTVQESIRGEGLEGVDAVPFELSVLEALLFLTSSYFDVRIGHLNFMYDGVLHDMREGSEPFSAVASEALVQQLTPLDKAITAVRSDARETREAIAEILNNEDALLSICLSQARSLAESSWAHDSMVCPYKPSPSQSHSHSHVSSLAHTPHAPIRKTPGLAKHHHLPHQPHELRLHEESDKEQVRRMLATYEREMSSVMGQLEEMRENLDGTREAWGMRMDAARNEIILVNLKMTLISLCLMVCVTVPSMFGMNISHNLPDQPWVFYSVCGASIMISVLSYPLASYWFKKGWKSKSASEVARFTSLRLFLMQHLDDLDDIRASLDSIRGQVDRAQFKRHLKRSLPGTKFAAGALDCLFDQYDRDRDGVVREVEINQRNAKQESAVNAVTAGMPEDVKRAIESPPLEGFEALDSWWRPKPKHSGKGR